MSVLYQLGHRSDNRIQKYQPPKKRTHTYKRKPKYTILRNVAEKKNRFVVFIRLKGNATYLYDR